MSGMVKDAEGKPLGGVTVKATHKPTGTVYGAISQSNGRYRIINMRIGGPYDLVVTAVGREPGSQMVSYLGLGEEHTVNFQLTDKAVESKAVEVVANRDAVINTSRTGAAEYVGEQQITSFPSISRNFQDFAKFSPQATPTTGSTGVSVGGRNNRFNNIQVDGTQYNDLFGLGASGTPGGQASTTPISLDAVQEFQVLVAPFDVRQGRFSAGGINAVTRSGTNNWEGSAYYYFRNEGMIGDLTTTNYLLKDASGNTLPVGEYRDTTIKTPYNKFNEYQLGARVGGPLIQDKLFFFLSFENTHREAPAPQLGFIQNTNNDLVRSIADTMGQILRTQYGYDPGVLENQNTVRPSLKLFGRIDWNLDEKNTITLRHNFVDASDDVYSPSRTSVLFGNRLYTFNSTTNSTVLQWHGTFSENVHNELIAGMTLIRDSRNFSGARYPTVNVSDARTTGINYSAGAENFSIANSLSTDVFEITDNLTFLMGDHTITVGTQNEFFSFRNLFIRDNAGTWAFNSLNDFRNGISANLQYSFARPEFPADFAAEFSTAQLGVYGQDEWELSDNFRLTLGLRVDMPLFLDNPSYNSKADTIHFNTNTIAYANDPNATLGLRTDEVPGLNPLFSPRLGFNWSDGSEKPLQIRGGVGLFSGRVPFVWIGNQYANTGVEFARVDTRPATGDTLRFNPTLDPRNNPAFLAKAGNVTEVNITAGDFRMPQNLRVNLAIDKELFWGLIASVEGIYSRTLNDIYYRNLNLGDRQDTTPFGRSLPGGRGVYGTYNGRNTTPRTQVGSFTGGPFNNIIELGNTSEGYTYSITAQLKKQFEDGWFASVAYTNSASYDQNSGTSSQAISNWRFNHTQDSPNEVALSRGLFDMPHRFLATLSKRFAYGSDDLPFATTISAFYELRSGQPYSYVYDGDINADGQTENDLIYIPANRDDIVLGSFGSNDSLRPANATVYDQLNAYIERDDYLSQNRGNIAERFGGREPIVQQLDLRLLQELPNPIAKGHHLDISVDVINFLNLLNPEWGRIQTVSFNRDRLLRFEGLVRPTTKQDPQKQRVPQGTPVFSYVDKKNPYGFNDLLSRYQIQIGIRYTF
jgi:outer membrane receptor protein involved in Fe transport